MALAFQNLPISFESGVDTKTDGKQLVVGKMEVLENATFQSPKQIKKRDGVSDIPRTVLSSANAVTNGVGISSYQSELVVLDGTRLLSYSPDIAKQVNKGTLVPVNLGVTPVIRNTFQQTSPDTAYRADTGIQVFTWLDSGSGGINYSVIDTTTGVQIVSNGVVSATGTAAKVLTLGQFFFIVYHDSSNSQLNYRLIDKNAPNVIQVAVPITSDLSSAVPAFDATIINTKAYIAYRIGTTQIGFYSFTTALVPSVQYIVTTNKAVNKPITVVGDASFNVWVSYGSVEAGPNYAVWALVVNAALNATILANTQLYITSGAPGLTVKNITMIVSGTTATVLWEDNFVLGSNTVTIGGSIGTAAFFLYAIGLASKFFTYGGVNYFLGIYNGNALTGSTPSIQPTYFLFNSSQQAIMRLAPGVAGAFYTTGLLPEVISISASKWNVPYLKQDNLSSLNGNIFYKTGVMCAAVDFTLPYAPQKLSLGSDLHFASGQLWMYDGTNVVEHGFHLFPEDLGQQVLSSGGGIGSSVNTGGTINQVQYVALYEWSDNQGNVHRSATSPVITVPIPLASSLSAITFTATATQNSQVLSSVSSFTGLYVGQVLTDTTNATTLVAGTYITRLDSTNSLVYLSQPAQASHVGDTFSTKDVCQIAIQVPTLQVTQKSNVSIVLYRTENNQAIFYRVSSLTALTYNNKAVDYVTITDSLPDNAIIGNEQLYTTGGEVDNVCAPAISALTPFKNRAIYLSPENPFQWGYSKQVIDGSPVEFSSQLFVENIDQRIGRLSAAGSLDDKLILFGPRAKFYVAGSGPSPNGSNNDFTEGTIIAGTTGCTNPSSILEIPVGLVYQDPLKGIWLLDRSLQERYIGADVEAYNSQTVTSAQKVPNQNKVEFTLSNGTNLVYDYYVNQWETDIVPFGAKDSTTYQDRFIYVQSDGFEVIQTPGTYVDSINGDLYPVLLRAKTGWLNLAGIQGFQRIKEIQIVGTYFSPHVLTVNIYTDFSDSISQTRTIPVTSDPGLYQFRIRMKVQKCESMRIEIIESQPQTLGQGLSLSALTLNVGLKKGLNKLPAGASF